MKRGTTACWVRRVNHFAGAVAVDEFRGSVLGSRAGVGWILPLLDAGKERRGAVVVVLRPALEGVVVALGALHADAEEQLRRRLRQVRWVRGDAVVIRRRVREPTADGGQQLPDHHIDAGVLVDMIVQPFLEDKGAFDLNRLAIAAQDIGPFQRPQVSILGPVQQRVDELGPFVCFRALQKSLGLGRGRQHTAHVHIHAADKFLVGTQVRGQDIEHLQLGEDVLIDVVVFGRIAPLEAVLGLEVRQPHGDHFVQKAAQDGHLPALAELDQAVGLHRGDGRVAAAENRQASHVADSAVAEVSLNRQLLPAHWLVEQSRSRQYFHFLQLRQVGGVVPQPLGEPGQHGPARHTFGREALAALMRHLAQSLHVDQTGLWPLAIRAAAEDVARQRQIIGRGIVAAQAQFETVLAAGCPVAGARVATAHVHGGNELMAKTDQGDLFHQLHLDRHRHRLTASLDDQRGGAVVERRQEPIFIEGSDAGFCQGQVAEVRQIADATVCVTAGDHNLGSGPRTVEHNGTGLHAQADGSANNLGRGWRDRWARKQRVAA